MRTAVISDIHGNATAFEAVLDDITRNSGAEAAYCLGDNIGYGPEPEKVVEIIRRHGIPSVLGNHELAVNRPETLSWFNPAARRSLEITMTMLSSEAKDYIAGMETCMTREGSRFVHGFPPDSPTTYLFEVPLEQVKYTMDRIEEKIVFVGHTHELMIIESDGIKAFSEPLYKGRRILEPDNSYIINVGSVGQPRDGSREAKYVIWDDSAGELEVRFIDYDVEDTVKKIYSAGLPEQHALRLL